MNQVSDLKLAIAVSRAGVYPSLSLYNYETENDKINLESFSNDLKKFKSSTNSNELLISMGAKNFLDLHLIDILLKQNILVVELIEDVNLETIDSINNMKKKFPEIKIFVKILGKQPLPNVDGLILKGPEGAGRSKSNPVPLIDMFTEATKKLPNLMIIPSGGISKTEDIQKYIKLGAKMVGIGSLFAATKESPISIATKLKIVKSTSTDLKRFNGLNQQGLIFKELENDDENRTGSLKHGMADPTNGHIFIGSSIDNIKKILTVKELVKELTANLEYD